MSGSVHSDWCSIIIHLRWSSSVWSFYLILESHLICIYVDNWWYIIWFPFQEWVTDNPFVISPRITFEVSVRLLGGLMALGYTIATILKRSTHAFSSDRVCVKLDWLEQLNRQYVQVLLDILINIYVYVLDKWLRFLCTFNLLVEYSWCLCTYLVDYIVNLFILA